MLGLHALGEALSEDGVALLIEGSCIDLAALSIDRSEVEDVDGDVDLLHLSSIHLVPYLGLGEDCCCVRVVGEVLHALRQEVIEQGNHHGTI